MSKTIEDIKISLNVSLKRRLKECFQQKFLNKNSHFKICKNTTFYHKFKNLHFRVKSDVLAPNCEKLIEKALFVIKKRIFC